MKPLLRRRAVAIVLAMACSSFASSVRAADWKIETRIYEGDRRQPSVATTTYFHDGVYYDVLGEPPRVTMFTPDAGRMTLVDMNRRQTAQLKTEDLERLSARFRLAAKNRSDAAIQFAAGGELTKTFDEREQALTVGGSPLTYRVECERPNDAAAATEIRAFSDWCARLNSIQPGGLPARVRLAVNEQLSDRGLIPSTVSLTTQDGRQSQRRTLRSEHTYAWQLSSADLERVAAVRTMAGECKQVSLRQYLGHDASAQQDESGDRRTAGREKAAVER